MTELQNAQQRSAQFEAYADIIYNNQVVAAVPGNTSITLHCAGTRTTADIIIRNLEDVGNPSFKVDATTYELSAIGDKWQDWISNTVYNIDGYQIKDGVIVKMKETSPAVNCLLYNDSMIEVSPEDIIINKYQYVYAKRTNIT